MNFDNHSPINMKNAKLIASSSRDGGFYRNCGWDVYEVFQGKKIHLVNNYFSGCNNDKRRVTHLGVFADAHEVCNWILANTETPMTVEKYQSGKYYEEDLMPIDQSNELLKDLGFQEEEA